MKISFLRSEMCVMYIIHCTTSFVFCEWTDLRGSTEGEHISYMQNCNFRSKPHVFGCWIGCIFFLWIQTIWSNIKQNDVGGTQICEEIFLVF
jgi:hypothetical protein